MMKKPHPDEIRIARQWWRKFPEFGKCYWSIWDILAAYAEHTLETRTVSFADTDNDGHEEEEFQG